MITDQRLPTARAGAEPVRLTREVKHEEARVGLSTVGVAAYDPKYTFVGAHAHDYEGRAVVIQRYGLGAKPRLHKED